MKRAALTLALIASPGIAVAVGSDSDTPATPTQTTTECSDGLVWDAESRSCVAPKESRLDNDTLYRAAREFAYAGQYDHALGALNAMSEGESDRVLTYLGFVHRKMGNTDKGHAYYTAAITRNPDNLLARSYYGQSLALEGNFTAAQAQLSEIRVRGGRGSWPEVALRLSLESGNSRSY